MSSSSRAEPANDRAYNSAPASSDTATAQLSGIRSLGYQAGACPKRVARMSTTNMSAIAAASNSSAWLGTISNAAHATSEGTTLKIRRDLRAAAAAGAVLPIARPQ